MAIIGLNIYTSGLFLWRTERSGGAWVQSVSIYDAPQPFAIYGAGSYSPTQLNNMGIIAATPSDSGILYFLGNGSPTSPVSLSGVVDPQPLTTHSAAYNHVNGARWVNNAYWLFGEYDYLTEKRAVCARSTDGVTWARQDEANGPTLQYSDTLTGFWGRTQDVWWDGANSFYVYLLRPSSGDHNSKNGGVWKFDTSANGGLGAWTQETTMFTGPDRMSRHMHHDGFVVLYSSGNIGVIYTKDRKAGGIGYRFWNGATWSGETVVKAAPALFGGLIYTAGRGHVAGGLAPQLITVFEQFDLAFNALTDRLPYFRRPFRDPLQLQRIIERCLR